MKKSIITIFVVGLAIWVAGVALFYMLYMRPVIAEFNRPPPEERPEWPVKKNDLLSAVSGQDVEGVKAVLRNPGKLAISAEESPLFRAVHSGNPGLVRLVLENRSEGASYWEWEGCFFTPDAYVALRMLPAETEEFVYWSEVLELFEKSGIATAATPLFFNDEAWSWQGHLAAWRFWEGSPSASSQVDSRGCSELYTALYADNGEWLEMNRRVFNPEGFFGWANRTDHALLRLAYRRARDHGKIPEPLFDPEGSWAWLNVTDKAGRAFLCKFSVYEEEPPVPVVTDLFRVVLMHEAGYSMGVRDLLDAADRIRELTETLNRMKNGSGDPQ